MSDTSTTTTDSTDADAQSVAKLTAALKAEREAHKATRAQYLAPIRSALGLDDTAGLDAVTSALSTRLGDTDKLVAERTAALTAERDAAQASAASLQAERNSDRIDHAITAALARSGIKPECADDAAAHCRAVLGVNDKGEVCTVAAPGVVPGMTADQWIIGQLRAMRAHYWPLSTGGGARGGSLPVGNAGNDSCFKPGPTWSVSRQFAFESQYGAAAARQARKRWGTGGRA